MKKYTPNTILEVLAQSVEADYCALMYRTIFELAIATILSAQCTDKRVNKVLPPLVRTFPTPEAMATAKREDIEALIYSTGFYKNKAKNIQGLAQMIIEKHEGQIPNTMEELLKLPGVARKTANVILTHGYGIIAGITVDTHVLRVAHRLGLTSQSKNALKTEKELMELFPKKDWPMVTTALIHHGRGLCDAKKPQCAECPLHAGCLYYAAQG